MSGRNKVTYSTIILVALVALIAVQSFGWFDFTTMFQKDAEGPTVDTSGMVTVTRTLSFVVTNQYGGSAITSATVKVYKGMNVQETLTTDGTTGIIATGLQYSSGESLKILIIKGNAKSWYSIIVPKIRKTDVDAITAIQMPMKFFDLDTSVSIQLVDGQGNAYSTGENLNFTALGLTQVNLRVSGYVSADDKSYISSYDQLNTMKWNVIAYGSLSGANYEDLSVSGWHGSYTKGTTRWGYRTISDDGVTKNKIGNLYEHDGVFTFTLTVGKGGYAGSAADLVFYLQAYSDPVYHEQYGSYGPDTVAMASAFTLNIIA